MKEKGIVKLFRIILGLACLFFGLNGFFQFMTPPEMSAEATALFGAFYSTGYLLPLMNLIFLAVGVMLLLNRSVPFALVLLAPISVNIVLFHLFLEFATGLMGYIFALINLYLMIVHANSYRPMFRT